VFWPTPFIVRGVRQGALNSPKSLKKVKRVAEKGCTLRPITVIFVLEGEQGT
jgi:hypothetical protein